MARRAGPVAVRAGGMAVARHPSDMRPHGDPASSRRTLLALAILLVLAIATLYAPVRHMGFLTLDDPAYITENRYVRGGLTADGVRHALYGSRAALWMPLSFLSHMIDVELFGLDPAGPHLVNVAYHAANAVLVLLLLYRTTGAVAASAAVAALFALHPLRVESVVWIAERKDVLSVFFGLVTLHAWVSYVRHPRFGRYLLVVLATALALLAKPMLVTLPAVLLLLDVWPLRRLAADGAARATRRQLLLEKVPLLLLAGATAAITVLSARASASMQTLAERPLGERLAHATVSYVWYVGKTLWPADLAVFYPYPTWSAWHVGGAVAVLGATALVTIAAWRRMPWLAFGFAWFVGALFPVIGFFQAGSQGMADRFTYLPSIGLLTALVWTVDRLARGPRARIALATAAVGVAAVFATASARQLARWHDPYALYAHTLAVTGPNWMIETELGNVLLRGGDAQGAYARFDAAHTTEPRSILALQGLGLAATALGRPAEAELHYRAALRIDRTFVKAHNNLGILLFERGDFDGALYHLSKAARLDSEYPETLANLRLALARIGVTDVDGYLRRLDALTAAAAEDRDRPGGERYGATLMGQLLGGRLDVVRGCFEGDAGTPAPFELYVAIAADGAIDDVAALPPTGAARCLGDGLRTARAPIPPFAPFHAVMSMQFEG
jgi:tetratricopeptide (TPR) repeat protein